MSMKHLQPYADQLMIPDPGAFSSKHLERQESSERKIGRSASRPQLKLVAGIDVSV
jgi:hypothetical protein